MGDYLDNVTDPECRRLRVASGEIDDDRPLVTFLYLLARDEIPVGDFEAARDGATAAAAKGLSQFTNGWLARWAQDMADQLVPAPAPGVAPPWGPSSLSTASLRALLAEARARVARVPGGPMRVAMGRLAAVAEELGTDVLDAIPDPSPDLVDTTAPADVALGDVFKPAYVVPRSWITDELGDAERLADEAEALRLQHVGAHLAITAALEELKIPFARGSAAVVLHALHRSGFEVRPIDTAPSSDADEEG